MASGNPSFVPSTRTSQSLVTLVAGFVKGSPFTVTLPARIHLSASLREQRPARAIRFAIRSMPLVVAAGGNESFKKLFVAVRNMELGMPLYAKVKTMGRVFYAFDDAVWGFGIDCSL